MMMPGVLSQFLLLSSNSDTQYVDILEKLQRCMLCIVAAALGWRNFDWDRHFACRVDGD